MKLPKFDLNDNKSLLIYTALAAVIGIGGYLAYNKIKALILSLKRNDTLRESAKDIQTTQKNFTDGEYASFADRIYRAMNGAGTNFDTVSGILKQLQSKTDYLMLQKYFGVRKSTVWMSSFEGNLIEWLEDELRSSQMEDIRSILLKIGVII